MLPIEPLNPEAFAPFGTLLRASQPLPAGDMPYYEKIKVLPSDGWIWALYTVRHRETRKLECHPNTHESFEPLQGMGVLLVAPPNYPDQVRAFALDEPVLLHPGVWHDLLSLSAQTTVKIVENNEVETEFHELFHPVRLALVTV